MVSPGKSLIDLAKFLETELGECGVELDCVDLAFPASVVDPLEFSDGKWLKIDVGFDQNPFRAVRDTTGRVDEQKLKECNRLWRFTGLVRVSGHYCLSPVDCCHENTEFMYDYTNVLWVVSELTAKWLEHHTDGGGMRTDNEFVYAYNGGVVTTTISFTALFCRPDCNDLADERAGLKGLFDGIRK